MIFDDDDAQLKKEKESMETVPPGYDPEADVVSKPKSKSAKRNERKKEKRLQVYHLSFSYIMLVGLRHGKCRISMALSTS